MNRFIFYLIVCGILSANFYAQDSTGTSNNISANDTVKKDQSKSLQQLPQNKHGRRFVDENGDGYNDNAPDHDGDGIPNGLDSDYTGSKNRRRHRGFIDIDGDGINDNSGGRGNRGKNSRHGRYSQTSDNFGDTTGYMDSLAQPNTSRKDSLGGREAEDSSNAAKKETNPE